MTGSSERKYICHFAVLVSEVEASYKRCVLQQILHLVLTTVQLCSHYTVFINKLMSVFLCVCPVIDHKFRHNIVKVAVDLPSGCGDYFDNADEIYCR